MPETACLHIHAGESDPVRVVELAGASVRIGRAVYCDVRLSEPEVAEEECLLRRRGKTWHLVPVARPGSVVVDGTLVERPRPLPFGVPLRVGDHSLILRPVERKEDGWGTYQTPIPVAAPSGPVSAAERLDEGPRLGEQATPPRAEKAVRGEDRLSRHEEWLASHQTAKRWEEKWRSVGAKLRERSVPPAAPTIPRASQPVAPPLSETAPLREYEPGASYRTLERRRTRIREVAPRPSSRAAEGPAEPTVAPVVESSAAPVETFSAAAPAPETAVPAVEPISSERAPQDAHSASGSEPVAVVTAPEAPANPSAAAEAKDGDAVEEQHAAVEAQNVASPAIEEPAPVVEDVTDSRESAPAEVSDADASQAAPRESALDGSEPPPLLERERTSDAPSTSQRGTKPPERPVQGTEPRAEAWEYPVPFVTDTSSTEIRGGATDSSSEPAHSRVGAELRDATDVTPRGGASQTSRAPAGDLGYRAPSPVEPRPLEGPAEPSTGHRSRTGPEWPSAREVFEIHQRHRATERKAVEPAPRTKRRRGPGMPMPTEPRPPAEWSLPLWLAWLPVAVITSGTAAAGLFLAWTWTQDGVRADRVARRLAGVEPAKKPLLEEGEAPPKTWWKSSGNHLALWAAYLDRSDKEPVAPDESTALLAAAAQASPLNPTVRYAAARPDGQEGGEPQLLASLGLGRDVVTLAWAGHELLKAGKREPALRAYRQALEMAAKSDATRLESPAFVDDPQTRRYAMPHEALIGPIVRDMAEHPLWTYGEWSEALPGFAVGPLAAARALRERSPGDALKALDAALAMPEEPTLAGAPTDAHLAAQAEALALKSRWAEAEERYQRAIDIASDERARRSWWLNLADIEQRLNEEAKRQKALEAAKSVDTRDEITQRAIELQRLSGGVGRPAPRSGAKQAAVR